MTTIQIADSSIPLCLYSQSDLQKCCAEFQDAKIRVSDLRDLAISRLRVLQQISEISRNQKTHENKISEISDIYRKLGKLFIQSSMIYPISKNHLQRENRSSTLFKSKTDPDTKKVDSEVDGFFSISNNTIQAMKKRKLSIIPKPKPQQKHTENDDDDHHDVEKIASKNDSRHLKEDDIEDIHKMMDDDDVLRNNNNLSSDKDDDGSLDNSQINNLKDETKDILGHLILRIAFSSSEKDDWLLKHEVQFLKFKLLVRMEQLITTHMMEDKYSYIANKLKELNSPLEYDMERKLFCGEFFQIPPYVLASRNCEIENGIATFPFEFFPLIFEDLFTKNFNMAVLWFKHQPARYDTLLAEGGLGLQNLMLDLERIDPEIPEKASAVGDLENLKENFAPLTLERLQTKQSSLPPCMRNILGTWSTQQKIKFNARMSLWPFLKDAGMSLSHQMELGRILSDRSTTNQKGGLGGKKGSFDKEHTYTMRHLYGQEGKRVEKKSYTCEKIWTIGKGDGCLGCPFKELPTQELEKMLINYGLPKSSWCHIEPLVQSNSYDVACHKFCEETVGAEMPGGLMRPVRFYIAAASIDSK